MARRTNIKLFHGSVYPVGKKCNNYVLSLEEFDNAGMLKFINVDLNEKWVGRPVSTTIENYDIINGTLFQSDVGSHFSDFKDDIKGNNFDPGLTFNNKERKFNLPPN